MDFVLPVTGHRTEAQLPPASFTASKRLGTFTWALSQYQGRMEASSSGWWGWL